MTATQTAPMARKTSYVQDTDFRVELKKTTDYGKFKFLNGNRDVNPLHLRRLKDSMRKNPLISPIIVNEKMEIIDGQHRFETIKDLGQVLYYIVIYGYGLKEVQILNTNSSNWKKEEYLKGYCDLNMPEYLRFKKFMEDFPELGIQACERILTQLKRGSKISYGEGKSYHKKTFEEGDLVIPDIDKSYEIAAKIMMIKPYYQNFYRATFVSTMLGILDNPLYNHAEFLHKLAQQPTIMQDCQTVTQYRILVEEIYNFRRREKVNLRF